MDARFLTPGQHGQVADFTGAHTKAGQVRVLVRNGIRHTLNAAGWPVVTWAAVEGQPAKQEDAGEWRSNARGAAESLARGKAVQAATFSRSTRTRASR